MNELGQFERRPNNSLIGRLQTMANKLGHEAFVNAIQEQKLRKTAKDNLDACRSREQNQTLLEFLKCKTVSIDDAFRNHNLIMLKDLCQEIGYSIESDSEFRNRIYQAYYTTFFSMMRKEKVKEANND
jgi:hypothetical protein